MALCRFYEAVKNGPRALSSLSPPSLVSGVHVFSPRPRRAREFELFVEPPLLDKVLRRLGP